MLVRGSLGSKTKTKKKEREKNLPSCFLVLFPPPGFVQFCELRNVLVAIISPWVSPLVDVLLLQPPPLGLVLLVFSWLSLVLWSSPCAGGCLVLLPHAEALSEAALGSMKPHGGASLGDRVLLPCC